MAAAQRDDALAALERVVRERRVELIRTARREGLDAEDALDCVHDALCTVLRLGSGEVPTEAEEYASFLARVVINSARNTRRRHRIARPHETLDAIEPSADVASTEALLALAEDCVRLRSCVNRLCQKQRTVVMMRLLEERPGEDVAAALGLTRGYVDVLLHRAKASLLVCMRDETEGEPS